VKRRFSWPLFWALVAVFVVIACLFIIPQFRDLLSGSWWLLTPFVVFFLLGVALIVFTLLEKVSGRLKEFFLLAGASAAAFLLSVLLHNAFYALGMDFLEAAFLFMAVLICPVVFLVGAIGSIVLRLKSSG